MKKVVLACVLALAITGLASAQDWVTIIPGSGMVPVGALRSGTDSDQSPLYIIRASYQGSLVVGKYSPAGHKAYIPYGGNEVEITNDSVEIYVGYGSWEFSPKGAPPRNAIVAGSENDGTPLYIIQGRWKGSLTTGKYSVHNHRGYLPYGGKEVEISKNFAFLVPSEMPEAK